MNRLLIPQLRAYRITDRFVAGNYPGSMDEEIAREKLAVLRKLGVTAFVNLMEQNELNWQGIAFRTYDRLLEADASGTGEPPVMHRFAIPDMAVPSPGVMKDILDAIDRLLAAGETVYLHCLGGVGRTGTVVGCWLTRHGIASGEDALAEINRLREYDPMLDMPSPQTAEQRAFVRAWSEGQ